MAPKRTPQKQRLGMTRRQSRLLATTTLAATLLWLLIAPAQTSMELAGIRALVDDEITIVIQVRGKLRGRLQVSRDTPKDQILDAARQPRDPPSRPCCTMRDTPTTQRPPPC